MQSVRRCAYLLYFCHIIVNVFFLDREIVCKFMQRIQIKEIFTNEDCFFFILKGTTGYSALLLVPVEGFGQCFFLHFGHNNCFSLKFKGFKATFSFPNKPGNPQKHMYMYIINRPGVAGAVL